MSVELLKAIFDWVAVVLVGFTFIAGAGALITGRILSDRQDAQLRKFDTDLTKAKTDLTEQQERAAKAEGLIAEAGRHAAEADAKAEGFRLDIAKANERAAGLEVEALKLREQLVAQGPRENLLRGEIRKNLVNALKPFAGQRIDVRRSASVIEVNGAIVMSTPIGDDTIGLAQSFIGILGDAGWSLPSTPLLSSFQGQGLKVEIVQNFSPETLSAAKALVEALKKIPLAVQGPLLDNDEQAKRVGKDVILPGFDENTLILTVLAHP